MKTVLLATGGAPGLWPLTERTAAGLLPVADKPLLVHAIESLAMAKLTDVILIIDAFGDEMKRTLGEGSKWGMQFDYHTTKSGESPRDLLHRVAVQLNQDYLLINGQILRTPIISEFLTQAATMKRIPVTATIRGVPAGVSILRRGSTLVPGNWDGPVPLSNETATVEFHEARLSLIESAAALHRANLDVIAGHFPGLLLAGRDLMPGVKVGRHSRLAADAVKGAPVFVGTRCRVAANAEVMSYSVVSSDSVIDRYALLSRAVIMPNTYIGALLEVSDAIVAGNLLIHVDTGTYTRVTDSFLLSRVEERNIGAIIRDSAARAAHRIRLALSPVSRPLALPVTGADEATPAEVHQAGNDHRRLERNPVVEGIRRVNHVGGV
jgi:mannose-1-phosphate guanylyltransferase / phosphomannomutase